MISVSNLHFSYGRRNVFEGLDLNLESGHIYGLLGKNGSGKSTLLRAIAGLVFPQQGNINVLGHSPRKRVTGFLQQIYLVPEEFYLPDIRIAQLVKYHLAFYPAFSHSLLDKYLREFEIADVRDLRAMSYGQRKKVLIACCLASNTALVLMDEPTNGLDIVSKSQFRKVMAGCLDEKKCILISTHQVKDLENLIDRVTVLDNGQILFDQRVETISRRLSFKNSFDPDEIRLAIYAELSLRGHSLVTIKEQQEESKLDLELLYKAVLLHGEIIKTLFNE